MADIERTRYAVGTLVFILLGPIIWAAHFTFVYGSQSSLCAAQSLTDAGVTGLASGLTLFFIVLLAAGMTQPGPVYRWIAGRALPSSLTGFVHGAMQLLGGLSLIAMVYAGMALAILPPCDQLR